MTYKIFLISLLVLGAGSVVYYRNLIFNRLTIVYVGSIKIEPTTFEKIIGILEGKGCKETVTVTNKSPTCSYRLRQLPDTPDDLVVSSWDGRYSIPFVVTKEKLFFQEDTRREPDFEKLKTVVRRGALFMGVQIQENSWTLESRGIKGFSHW